VRLSKFNQKRVSLCLFSLTWCLYESHCKFVYRELSNKVPCVNSSRLFHSHYPFHKILVREKIAANAQMFMSSNFVKAPILSAVAIIELSDYELVCYGKSELRHFFKSFLVSVSQDNER